MKVYIKESMIMTDTALLLIDLQNEMVDPAGKIGAGGLARAAADAGVLDNAARVLAAARRAGLAIVHVRLGFQPGHLDALSVAPRIARLKEHGAALLGTWGTEFPAAVAPVDGELVITKQCVNPFYNTGLLNWLLRHGIRRVVIGGVATNLAVESAVRAADDAGLAPVVLHDCCAAPNADWHRFSIENIIPVFGSTTTADAFIQTLG